MTYWEKWARERKPPCCVVRYGGHIRNGDMWGGKNRAYESRARNGSSDEYSEYIMWRGLVEGGEWWGVSEGGLVDSDEALESNAQFSPFVTLCFRFFPLTNPFSPYPRYVTPHFPYISPTFVLCSPRDRPQIHSPVTAACKLTTYFAHSQARLSLAGDFMWLWISASVRFSVVGPSFDVKTYPVIHRENGV